MSTCCYSWGTRFNLLHPHGSLQTSVTSAPGFLMSSSTLISMKINKSQKIKDDAIFQTEENEDSARIYCEGVQKRD